jgi:hypothetical protein
MYDTVRGGMPPISLRSVHQTLDYVGWDLSPAQIERFVARPVAVLVDRPAYASRTALGDDTLAELRQDLQRSAECDLAGSSRTNSLVRWCGAVAQQPCHRPVGSVKIDCLPVPGRCVPHGLRSGPRGTETPIRARAATPIAYDDMSHRGTHPPP